MNAKKLETRNVPVQEKAPRFVSGNGKIKFVMLKDTLNRIRLIGPESQFILGRTLNKTTKPEWWPDNLDFEKKIVHFSENLSQIRPGEVKAGSVFSVTVRDPRTVLPGKRGGIETRKIGPSLLELVCVSIAEILIILRSRVPAQVRYPHGGCG